MGRAFVHGHHVRERYGAFLGNDKHDVGMVCIFAAVRVEVEIDQDGDFTGQDAGVRGLLGYDGVVLLQLLEVVDGGLEVVHTAAQRLVDGDGAGVAQDRASGVQIPAPAAVYGFKQIGNAP